MICPHIRSSIPPSEQKRLLREDAVEAAAFRLEAVVHGLALRHVELVDLRGRNRLRGAGRVRAERTRLAGMDLSQLGRKVAVYGIGAVKEG